MPARTWLAAPCLAVLVGGAVQLSACTLAPMMPPINASYAGSGVAPTPAPSWPVRAPAPSPEAAAPHPRTSTETAGALTRVSVATHPGSYFLWIQKPQLTWFYVVNDSLQPPAPVSTVYLVFRLQSPQGIAHNRLTLVCNGVGAEVAGAPDSRLESHVQTSSHFLTYAIPRETFLAFAGCAKQEVQVGGVTVAFDAMASAKLTALAEGMPGGISSAP